MTCWLPVVACAAVFFTTTVASAHSYLQDPMARSVDDGQTTGPCGGYPIGDPAAEYVAGSTIDLTWAVGQSHGNVFRVAFSPGDDLGFDDNVLVELPDLGDVSEVTQAVELPSCTCDGCTLQLAQYTISGNAAYYSCADIRLVGPEYPPCPAASGDDGSTGSSDGSTGNGDESTGGGEGPSDDDGEADDDGGSTGDDGDSPTEASAASQGNDDGSSDDGGAPAQPTQGADGCGCSTHPALGTWWLAVLLLARRRARVSDQRR